MSMKPLQTGVMPLGQFDCLDTDISSLLGGEVVTLVKNLINSTDLHAADQNDGYAGTTNKYRPVVTKTLISGSRPLFLADEGTTGYGTLFGTVVGGTVGQVVSGGAVLGPHTALGSGKCTLWNQPGLYAVSLDAVDTTATTGLVPENSSLASGVPLYATSSGKLTPLLGSAFEAVSVARFIEFQTTGSLVTSRLDMVAALNSGGGPVRTQFAQAVIYFSSTAV